MDSRIPLGSIVLLIAVSVVGLIFLESPGTRDTARWVQWMEATLRHGPVRGFASNSLDYPPFTTLIFWLGAVVLKSGLGWIHDNWLIAKLLIYAFWTFSLIQFWFFSNRDVMYALAFGLATALNALALGYVDIFVVPFLLAAVWSLQRLAEARTAPGATRYLVYAVTGFFLACFTKWQPVVAAPITFLFVLKLADRSGILVSRPRLQDLLRRETWAWQRWDLRMLGVAAATGATLLAASFLVYGAELGHAFERALGGSGLSANALNFNWIVSETLHATAPERYGVTGVIWFPGRWSWLASGLYWSHLAVVCWAYVQSESRSFPTYLRFALLSFVSYVMFNPGVHENHYFIASILALLVMVVDGELRPEIVVWLLVANANLVLFYGVDGQGLRMEPLQSTLISVALSLLAVVAYYDLFLKLVIPRGRYQEVSPEVAQIDLGTRGAELSPDA